MQDPVVSLSAVGASGVFGSGQPWSGYISAAKPLVAGAQALAASARECAEAHALVAGFAVEALLKGLLAYAKVDPKKLISGPGKHNLKTLWERAATETSLLSSTPPHWLEALNAFHDSPYVVRYMDRVNFYVPPSTSDVQAGLETLFQTVLLRVASDGGT